MPATAASAACGRSVVRVASAASGWSSASCRLASVMPALGAIRGGRDPPSGWIRFRQPRKSGFARPVPGLSRTAVSGFFSTNDCPRISSASAGFPARISDSARRMATFDFASGVSEASASHSPEMHFRHFPQPGGERVITFSRCAMPPPVRDKADCGASRMRGKMGHNFIGQVKLEGETAHASPEIRLRHWCRTAGRPHRRGRAGCSRRNSGSGRRRRHRSPDPGNASDSAEIPSGAATRQANRM